MDLSSQQFGFLLYFLSDRIIETNNKGGNVATETNVNWLFLEKDFFNTTKIDLSSVQFCINSIFQVPCLMMFIL